MKIFAPLTAFPAALLVLAGQASAQTTWYVDASSAWPGAGTQANPYADIQYAISRATTVSGDTVQVAAGAYAVPLDFQGKELVVQSTSGAASTIIQVSVSPVVRVASGEGPNTRLDGFTLLDGLGEVVGAEYHGGGIYLNGASLTVANCAIRDCEATRGGGIYAGGNSTLVLLDTVIHSNEAALGGGIHGDTSSAVIERCDVGQNVADDSGTTLDSLGGGLFFSGGALTIRDTQIRFNSCANSHSRGGGLYLQTPGVVLEDCDIRQNGLGNALSYDTHGGGLWCRGLTYLQATRCTFFGNSALNGEGGGIYGDGTFTRCVIDRNLAVEGGGVRGFDLNMSASQLIDNDCYPITEECIGRGGGAMGGTYDDCTFGGNNAWSRGGGAYQATLNNCLVENNDAVVLNYCNLGVAEGGGGLADCVATDCVIRGNRIQMTNQQIQGSNVTGGGGALASTLISCDVVDNFVSIENGWEESENYAMGGGTLDCDLTNCLVQGNELINDRERGAKGGGIFGGTATGCRILDNRAWIIDPGHPSASGGGAANATLDRCVLIGNSADHGGGAWDSTLTQCTLTRNHASQAGGAVSGYPGFVGGPGTQSELENCIAWNNSPNEIAHDVGLVVATYSDIDGGFAGVGNINADPRFWSQVSEDVRLLPGSPCIDSGNPASPLDQDSSVTDMGAYPFDAGHAPTPVNYCVGKENSSGCTPYLSSSGSPTLSGADDFQITANDLVNQKIGMAFWGRSPAALPFAQATLCVASPQQRTTLVSSGGSGNPLGDCSGSASFDFTHPYMASNNLVAGDRVYVQWWYRDPAQLDGTGIGLTDGVEFVVQP